MSFPMTIKKRLRILVLSRFFIAVVIFCKLVQATVFAEKIISRSLG